MTVFLIQVVFATIIVAMALAQKFSPRGDDECSLNSPEENEMGYGQVLAILLLVLPAIATFEAYKGASDRNDSILTPADRIVEEERKVRVEEAKEGLRPLLAIVHKVVLSSDGLAPQSEVRISPEEARALRNIMDGQWPGPQPLCPPSRQDTEQRIESQHGSTSSLAAVPSYPPEQGSGTVTSRGTWDAHD